MLRKVMGNLRTIFMTPVRGFPLCHLDVNYTLSMVFNSTGTTSSLRFNVYLIVNKRITVLIL